MKTLPERLKHARAKKGWSQGQLATAADVAPSTVGNIEQGTRLSKGSIPQLAEALGVSYKWLAYGEGEMDNSNPPSKSANDNEQLSPLARSLAQLFDKLPADDPVLQSSVYSLAAEPILEALGQRRGIPPNPVPSGDLEKPAESPQQQKAPSK